MRSRAPLGSTGSAGLLIPASGLEEVAPLISSGGRWASFEDEELADLIESLYADPDLCEEIGTKAMEHVRKNFTWKRAAEYSLEAIRAHKRGLGYRCVSHPTPS